MHKAVTRALTAEEIQTYHRDGVVLVRGLVDSDWVYRATGTCGPEHRPAIDHGS